MPLRDIVGHRIANRSLRNFLSRESIPHALLFHGADGCGKSTAAVAFAQTVNCESPADGDACGACPSCHRIIRGTDADVRLFSPQKREYVVEEAKEIIGFASYTAGAGNRKVLIISKAEFFNREAANKMLKVLEEPSASTIFILICASPFRLLPTIRSRAIPVPFHPLSVEEAGEVLRRLGVEVPPGRLPVLHRLAEGNVGTIARLATEDGLPELIAEAEAYFESALMAPLEAPPTRVAEHLLALAARFPVEKADTAARKTRSEATLLLETLLLYLRRRLRGQVEGATDTASGPRERFITARLMERVAETIRAIEGNANPLLELEVLVLRFMKAGQRAAAGSG